MTEPDTEVVLEHEGVRATFDLARGCDLVALVDERTGVDVMFASPWAGRAASVSRSGSGLHHDGSASAWLEGYRGGMQLLCPNAGAPSTFGGIALGFHGEAAVVRWVATQQDEAGLAAETELFTAPLRIERRARLDGGGLLVADTITNLAPVPVTMHAQYHPAFGSPLLSPSTVVECGARTFVVDPGADFTPLPAGSRHAWPPELPGTGRTLAQLPEREQPWAMLGWLTELREPWAALRNPDLDLGVVLSWDRQVHPNAWIWQELGLATDFPWFGRAYAMAIEPSDTVPSGPGRERALRVDPGGSRTVWIRLTLCPGARPIAGVEPDGTVRYA